MEQPVSPVSPQSPNVVPPQTRETPSVRASFKKPADKRRILIPITIGLFLMAGFYLISQLRKSPLSKKVEKGLLSRKAGEGGLVGIFHQNGTAYFGKLVFEDEKIILLRGVYQPAGFLADAQGDLVFQVFRRNEVLPAANQDYQIPKEEILFFSGELNPKVEEAIRSYKPPTPAPALTPTSRPMETPILLPSPETSPVPTPESGFRTR